MAGFWQPVGTTSRPWPNMRIRMRLRRHSRVSMQRIRNTAQNSSSLCGSTTCIATTLLRRPPPPTLQHRVERPSLACPRRLPLRPSVRRHLHLHPGQRRDHAGSPILIGLRRIGLRRIGLRQRRGRQPRLCPPNGCRRSAGHGGPHLAILPPMRGRTSTIFPCPSATP